MRAFGKYNKLIIALGLVASMCLFAYATVYGHLEANFWVFRCNDSGYSKDEYLAYCGDPAFGNYEHFAFFHEGLEPGVTENMRDAQVIFLGNSGARRTFSSQTLHDFFAAKGIPYYNMGLGYGEFDAFPREIIGKFALAPKAVVINADYFFYDAASREAYSVMHNTERSLPLEPRLKKLVQSYHETVCAHPLLEKYVCGNVPVVYRSRLNGRTTDYGLPYHIEHPTYEGHREKNPDYARFMENYEKFKSRLPAETCVILTVIPRDNTDKRVAEKLSRHFGVPFFWVPVDGLTSYDGNHLNPANSEKWSKAFLRQAGATIEACVAAPGKQQAQQ